MIERHLSRKCPGPLANAFTGSPSRAHERLARAEGTELQTDSKSIRLRRVNRCSTCVGDARLRATLAERTIRDRFFTTRKTYGERPSAFGRDLQGFGFCVSRRMSLWPTSPRLESARSGLRISETVTQRMTFSSGRGSIVGPTEERSYMPEVKYRCINSGLSPRRTKGEMPGWVNAYQKTH
jgi:hypothetical protein